MGSQYEKWGEQQHVEQVRIPLDALAGSEDEPVAAGEVLRIAVGDVGVVAAARVAGEVVLEVAGAGVKQGAGEQDRQAQRAAERREPGGYRFCPARRRRAIQAVR